MTQRNFGINGRTARIMLLLTRVRNMVQPLLKPTFSRRGDIIKPVVCTQFQPPYVDLNGPFIIKEMTEEISNMKTNKSVGYDRISNDIIKNYPINVKQMLLGFINLCLEKSLVPES